MGSHTIQAVLVYVLPKRARDTGCFKWQGLGESTEGWRAESRRRKPLVTAVHRSARGGASKGNRHKWLLRSKVSQKTRQGPERSRSRG